MTRTLWDILNQGSRAPLSPPAAGARAEDEIRTCGSTDQFDAQLVMSPDGSAFSFLPPDRVRALSSDQYRRVDRSQLSPIYAAMPSLRNGFQAETTVTTDSGPMTIRRTYALCQEERDPASSEAPRIYVSQMHELNNFCANESMRFLPIQQQSSRESFHFTNPEILALSRRIGSMTNYCQGSSDTTTLSIHPNLLSPEDASSPSPGPLQAWLATDAARQVFPDPARLRDVRAAFDRAGTEARTMRLGGVQSTRISPVVQFITQNFWYIVSTVSGIGVAIYLLKKQLAPMLEGLAMQREQMQLIREQMKGAPIKDPLGAFTEDLSERAERGEFAPLVGREAEIRQVMARLTDPQQPNVGITAAEVPGRMGAGVGKSALMQEIARRISVNDPSVPPALRGVRILVVSDRRLRGGNQDAGEGAAKFAGMYQERGLAVVDAARRSTTPLILDWEEAAGLFEQHAEGTQPIIKDMLQDLESRSPVVVGDMDARLPESSIRGGAMSIEVIPGKNHPTLPDSGTVTVYDAAGTAVQTIDLAEYRRTHPGAVTVIEGAALPRSQGDYYRIEIRDTSGTIFNRPNNWRGNVFITTAGERRATFLQPQWSNVNRRLDWVELTEMTADQTRLALIQQRGMYEAQYGGIHISDEAIAEAVQLGEQMEPTASNPGKAIKILKTAAAYLQQADPGGRLTPELVRESAARSRGTTVQGLEYEREARARHGARMEQLRDQIEGESVSQFMEKNGDVLKLSSTSRATHTTEILQEWRSMGEGQQRFWMELERQTSSSAPEGRVPTAFMIDYVHQRAQGQAPGAPAPARPVSPGVQPPPRNNVVPLRPRGAPAAPPVAPAPAAPPAAPAPAPQPPVIDASLSAPPVAPVAPPRAAPTAPVMGAGVFRDLILQRFPRYRVSGMGADVQRMAQLCAQSFGATPEWAEHGTGAAGTARLPSWDFVERHVHAYIDVYESRGSASAPGLRAAFDQDRRLDRPEFDRLPDDIREIGRRAFEFRAVL